MQHLFCGEDHTDSANTSSSQGEHSVCDDRPTTSQMELDDDCPESTEFEHLGMEDISDVKGSGLSNLSRHC